MSIKENRRASAVLLVALTAPLPLLAAGDADFTAGVQAFRAGDYPEAIERFERARRHGMTAPNLEYNLGVANYRLGRYAAARRAFDAAARDPVFATLAQYNLGLVALRLDERDVAISAFTLAAATPDEKIAALAQRQLDRLNRTSTKPAWHVSLGASGGYDDSIVDPTLLTPAANGDRFTELLLAAKGPLSAGGNLYVEFAGHLLRYASNSEYDSDGFRLGVSRTAYADPWHTSLRASVDHSRFADEGYLQGAHLAAQAKRHLTERLALLLDYRFSALQAVEEVYQPQEGTRHAVGGRLGWRDNLNEWELGYRFEYNDREDLDDGTTFTSYSPERHEIGVRVQREIGAGMALSAEASRRETSYGEPNRLVDGSRIRREDELSRVALGLSKRLGSRWQLEAGYEYNDNRSNLADYSYRQNIYRLGVSAFY